MDEDMYILVHKLSISIALVGSIVLEIVIIINS
jgi:hypothetical protein